MKKILSILFLTFSVSAMAHGPYYHGGYYRHGHNNWYWVGPTVIGGVIGYEIARNQQPVIVQQPPVIVQQQNCGPWTQVQNVDGTMTQTRICNGIQ